MDKKQETNGFNKIDLLPRDEDGFIDLDLVEDDSDYSNLPEVKVLDPELYNLFRQTKLVEPSEQVENNVMQCYRKEYRYRILWRKIRIKLEEWKSFLPLNAQRAVLASIGVLFIIGAVAYYQYQSSKNTNPSNLASQQTPIIKETPTTSPIPQSTAIATPNITENNKQDNDNKLDTEIKKQNDKKIVIANDQIHKSNKNNGNLDKNSKTNDNEEIANNININKTDPSIKDASNGDTLRAIIVDADLSEINDFYIASFGNEEENKELREALSKIFKNTDLNLLTTTESLFNNHFGEVHKKGDFINIVDSNNNKLLWQISIKGMTGSPKEISENIVSELLKDIKSQKEK